MQTLKTGLRWLLRGLLLGFIASLALVLAYSFVPVYITPLMVLRSASALSEGRWLDVDKTWVPLEDISPNIQRAVLKAEDYQFYSHNGFDFKAIQKAIAYNKTHKKKKGASTISQQTAKNVFLWPQRDWLRKGLEAYFTVLMEMIWTKERILEVYLNVIEFGPGVYGAEAAAQKYFQRSAKKLSPSQAALMAAVLPNPHKFRIERPSPYVWSRQRRILYRGAPAMPRPLEAGLWD